MRSKIFLLAIVSFFYISAKPALGVITSPVTQNNTQYDTAGGYNSLEFTGVTFTDYNIIYLGIDSSTNNISSGNKLLCEWIKNGGFSFVKVTSGSSAVLANYADTNITSNIKLRCTYDGYAITMYQNDILKHSFTTTITTPNNYDIVRADTLPFSFTSYSLLLPTPTPTPTGGSPTPTGVYPTPTPNLTPAPDNLVFSPKKTITQLGIYGWYALIMSLGFYLIVSSLHYGKRA